VRLRDGGWKSCSGLAGHGGDETARVDAAKDSWRAATFSVVIVRQIPQLRVDAAKVLWGINDRQVCTLVDGQSVQYQMPATSDSIGWDERQLLASILQKNHIARER
jgi:hypothetical protein